MDDRTVGRLIRAIRVQRGLRQFDVAIRARVSQSMVSAMERGRLEQLSLVAMRRIAEALDVALRFDPYWRGGDQWRLLDRDHAAIVEQVVAALRLAGFEVIVEYTFNHYGERGSVDIAAWHPGERALLLVEVKSRLTDLQDLFATFARKVRIVPDLLAREAGWDRRYLGRLLVVAGTDANRRVVADHSASFAATFPGRAVDVRRWLRRPSGHLGAIWFVRDSGHTDGTKRRGGAQRVRPVRDAS